MNSAMHWEDGSVPMTISILMNWAKNYPTRTRSFQVHRQMPRDHSKRDSLRQRSLERYRNREIRARKRRIPVRGLTPVRRFAGCPRTRFDDRRQSLLRHCHAICRCESPRRNVLRHANRPRATRHRVNDRSLPHALHGCCASALRNSRSKQPRLPEPPPKSSGPRISAFRSPSIRHEDNGLVGASTRTASKGDAITH